MTTRTTDTRVTFFRAFKLEAMDSIHPAGSYVVETDEELIEGFSVPAYRRTATYIVLPGRAGTAIASQTVRIEPGELQAALTAKLEASLIKAATAKSPELTLNDLLADRIVQKTISSATLPLDALKAQLRHVIDRRQELNAAVDTDRPI